MYLKKDKRANGRTYLSIVKSYRDPIDKKSRHKLIKRIGFFDELVKEYQDPIMHFTEVAKQMTIAEKEEKKLTITLNKNEVMSTNTSDIKNIGFAALSTIYHKLNIHKFLINRQRVINYQHPLNNAMKLLVYDRIFEPESKLATYDNKNFYVENFDFPLESLYRSLKIFAKYKDKLLLDIHENIRMIYGRDSTNVFYDVTNYFFHKDDESELIKKGMGKDRKGKPIVQMGMLLDNNGIPISYKLFSGNTNDFSTLLPMLDELKQQYHLDRAIVVADKGLNSGSNKAYNIIKGDGYIFSRSLRGTKADKETKQYALSDEGYQQKSDDYKIKSRVVPTEIRIEDINGKIQKVTIDEKQIIFYSEKYKKRMRHQRQKLIDKASRLINSPSRYAKAENYGAMKYIKGMKLDKKTGELTPLRKNVVPKLDTDLIKEEEKFDGYYSIVTSELDMPDEQVINRYRGLWKIEETFKVTKTILKARPVYVRTEESIEAHFLSCFIAVLILRLLELETGSKYSIKTMINSLKKANVDLLEMNKYKAVYYDEVLEHIGNCLGIDFSRKYLTLDEIKKMISQTK